MNLERTVARHQSPDDPLFRRVDLVQGEQIYVALQKVDIKLPFVTENNVAAARHAIGSLSALGHSSIALLQQHSVLAGHQHIREAVNEMCAKSGMTLKVLLYSDGVQDLCRRLDQSMESNNRPTALLTTKTPDVLTSITYLARKRMVVPEDVSIISLFDDPALDGIVPEITRYSVNEEHFVHQVFTLATKLLTGTRSNYKPVHLIPERIKGASLAKPPSG